MSSFGEGKVTRQALHFGNYAAKTTLCFAHDKNQSNEYVVEAWYVAQKILTSEIRLLTCHERLVPESR